MFDASVRQARINLHASAFILFIFYLFLRISFYFHPRNLIVKKDRVHVAANTQKPKRHGHFANLKFKFPSWRKDG